VKKQLFMKDLTDISPRVALTWQIQHHVAY